MDCEKVEICVTRCRTGAKLPFYAKAGDAGMDLAAAVEVTLAPGETKLIPTGLKVAIPEGFELQVRPRSGLSLHTPLRIPNAPGTIDAGYRDEICVILTNSSMQDLPADSSRSSRSSGDPVCPVYTISEKDGKQGMYRIMPGDRIAQIVLQKVPVIQWKEQESVTEIGCDRGGGFGSTGDRA